MTGFVELGLADNQIDDVATLHVLDRLEVLFLRGNTVLGEGPLPVADGIEDLRGPHWRLHGTGHDAAPR